jgi:hypothetical protein
VSQDSEQTVSEAGAGETATQVEQIAMESPYFEAIMTVVEKLTAKAAGGSTVQDMALVVVFTSLPSPPPAGQFLDNQHLEDDVVLEFDATYRLSKLTMAWEGLLARMTSFGEQLQVGIFFLLLFGGSTSFASFSYFLPFSVGEVFLSGSL